jgi:hypothetical protein
VTLKGQKEVGTEEDEAYEREHHGLFVQCALHRSLGEENLVGV